MFLDQQAIDILARGLILSAVGLVWVVITVRMIGLRTFSKMTAVDFVATIATGSLLAGAGQADNWPSFFQPLVAITGLLGSQYVFARLRLAFTPFEKAVQNNPVVLMRDGRFLKDALSQTRVAQDDLVAKLREANVLDLSQVRAVVLETTGDISVLHGSHLSDRLLSGVKRVD